MSEVYYVEGRKAGLFGTRESHEPRLLLSNFRTEDHPVAPPSWDGTNGITAWGMDGNDQWGSCGPAATDHGDVAKANDTSLIGKLGGVGPVELYFEYGRSMGEPGDQPDNGVDNASWLAFLYNKGIIKGYGEVPIKHMNHYAVAFNGLLMAVQLGDDAQEGFQTHPPTPWGSTGSEPNPDLGHDILFIKYDEDGNIWVVTWGGLMPCTAEFVKNNVTDVWAILDAADAKRAGIDWEALEKELVSIHGTISE